MGDTLGDFSGFVFYAPISISILTKHFFLSFLRLLMNCLTYLLKIYYSTLLSFVFFYIYSTPF